MKYFNDFNRMYFFVEFHVYSKLSMKFSLLTLKLSIHFLSYLVPIENSLFYILIYNLVHGFYNGLRKCFKLLLLNSHLF